MAQVKENEREAATLKFKEINEAFQLLSDETKRRKYDGGMDIEDIESGASHRKR